MQNAGTKLDEVWNKLSDGGVTLMPLDKYPFSERFGWIQDKYSVSWQLILTDPNGEPRTPILPSLLFVGDNCGKAEERASFISPSSAMPDRAPSSAMVPAKNRTGRER